MQFKKEKRNKLKYYIYENIYIYVIGLFFLLVMSGCVCLEIIYLILLPKHSEKKVTITKEYVINPNWTKTNNSLDIYRMKLKDSTKIINLNNPSEPELYYGLVKDTSFAYVANVKYNGEDYAKRKVFFNKDNGFVWRKPPNMDPSRKITFKTIGELQQKTWYMLKGLSIYHTTLYYVYIDSLDSVHVFKVWSMTNY